MFVSRIALTRALLLGVLASSTVACGDDSSNGAEEPSGAIEIFSWWISGGEVDALNELLEVQEARYPDTEVKNLAEDLAEQARDRLQQRMAEGAPPSTFQANIGADLLKWVLFNGSDDSDSKVEPLNDIAEQNGWTGIFPAPVVDALSHRGKMYGVPANIHRINSLFYNVAVFDDAGLTPPRTLEELKATAQTLKEQGYTPLCIGSEHWWTLELLAFEALLPAVAGGRYYERYWKGQESPTSEQMAQTLTTLRELWPYFNADADSLSWTAGVDHMFDTEETCAMTVMGDWAKGYLEAKGWTAGVDFDQVPFPGSDGTFVFTADCFPLPKGAPNRAGTLSLLETIGSVEGQIAFNRVKGSIPVRTDIDPNEFDSVQRQTMEDFASSTLVQARSGLLPSGSFADLGPALKQMLASPDTSHDGVMNVLANDYRALR